MSGKKTSRVEGMTQAIDDLLDFGKLTGDKKGGGGGKKKLVSKTFNQTTILESTSS